MTRRHAAEVDPHKILLLTGLGLFAVMTPLVLGGLKPLPAAQLMQNLSRMMTPTGQTSPRLRAPSQNLAKPAPRLVPAMPHLPQRVLAAPAIDAVIPMIIILPPQLAQEPEADIAETVNDGSDTPVCRAPQQLADSRLLGPRICLPQKEWDRLKAQGRQLMPDGRTLAVLHDSSSSPYACTVPAASTGTSTSMGLLGQACR